MPRTATHAPDRAALFSSKTDEWPTPMDFYRRLNDEFGFVLDVCSSAANHKAENYYALDHAEPARRDGLAQNWATDCVTHDGAGFCNPPYGVEIAKWMAKAHASAQAGAVVVCLVPVRASSAWWHDYVLTTGAEVRYVRGRLKFGSATTAAPFASAVVIYRPTDVAGQAGPVATMAATSAPKATSTSGASAAARQTVEAALAAYKPRHLDADRWALAADPVRKAVTAIEASKNTSTSVASALTKFLASPVWDGAAPPDLGQLLTDANIVAFTNLLPAGTSRSIVRSNLRRVARAIVAADLAGVPEVRAAAKHRYPDPLLVEGSQRDISAADLLHTWMRHRGTTMAANPLEPVISYWTGLSLPNDQRTHASTVLPSSSIRALAEVKDQTEKATVTSRTDKASPTASAASARKPLKPMSNRAARAHAQRARKAAADAAAPRVAELVGEVPADIRATVEAYRPRGAARATWSDNRDLGYRLVFGYRPPSINNAKTACSYVARFLHWYVSSAVRAQAGHTGPAIATEELLDLRLIEHHFAESIDLTERAVGTMRSALRRALRSLNPAASPQTVPYFPAQAPYNANECAEFVFVAHFQPTDIATANLCFIVGLGLGAGLDASDIRTLNRDSFTVAHIGDGDPVLLVDVGGARARTVPVRRAYADLVRGALDLHQKRTRSTTAPLIGRPSTGPAREQKNAVSGAIVRAKLASGENIALDVRRLRTTWLVAAMSSPIPLADLLRAAGLSSSRSLVALLPYCPVPSDERVVEVLATMDDVLAGPAPAYAERKRARS